MMNSSAEIAAEIDCWLCSFQRSMLHLCMEWQFDMMAAGFYRTPRAFIRPK